MPLVHPDSFPRDELLQDRFYELLWTKDHEADSCKGIRIPDSVLFRYDTITGWYFTSVQDQTIMRKSRAKLNAQEILEHMCRTRVSECVLCEPNQLLAYAIDSVTDKETKTKSLRIRYFDPDELRKYVLTGKQREKVVLQLFHEPCAMDRGKSVHTIQVCWTPRVFHAEMRVNEALFRNVHLPLCDRCATYDGPASMSRTIPVRSRSLENRLRDACHAMVRHAEAVGKFEYTVYRMVFYARVDAMDRLWILWCSELQLGLPHLGPSAARHLGPVNLDVTFNKIEDERLSAEMKRLTSGTPKLRKPQKEKRKEKKKKDAAPSADGELDEGPKLDEADLEKMRTAASFIESLPPEAFVAYPRTVSRSGERKTPLKPIVGPKITDAPTPMSTQAKSTSSKKKRVRRSMGPRRQQRASIEHEPSSSNLDNSAFIDDEDDDERPESLFKHPPIDVEDTIRRIEQLESFYAEDPDPTQRRRTAVREHDMLLDRVPADVMQHGIDTTMFDATSMMYDEMMHEMVRKKMMASSSYHAAVSPNWAEISDDDQLHGEGTYAPALPLRQTPVVSSDFGGRQPSRAQSRSESKRVRFPSVG